MGSMTTVMSSTNELTDAFAGGSFVPSFVAGPVWTSYEQFRRTGASNLESIPQQGVATLRTKTGTFRILRDDDFQKMLGLASNIHRIQKGLRIVMQAARVAVQHPDQEHLQLLMHSASMIAESPVLPERAGHETFELTPEEIANQSPEDVAFELNDIQRPKW